MTQRDPGVYLEDVERYTRSAVMRKRSSLEVE
jgi:hypothetical protein